MSFPFVRAEWRHLALLNYEVDPKILRPFVPRGTELDCWKDRTYVSMVGFLFLNTKIFGIGIPFHRNFEEVNLRFYVRRRVKEEWRRGVVFIRELVPRAAVALAARMLYNENYLAVPMSHRVEQVDGRTCSISYGWNFAGRENRLEVFAGTAPSEIPAGSEEEFITEHYWGYARQRDGGTLEYRVEHPRWRGRKASEAKLDCDAARLYGEKLAPFIKQTPFSAFLAEGSEVSVFRGVRLAT